MKLNEMLSGDIGNLVFVLQILLANIRQFFFSSRSVNLFQRCVVFLMTDFQPFSEQSLSDKCQERR